MSQLLGCLEHLETGALSKVSSFWGKENNHRRINLWSRADDGARTFVSGQKFLYSNCPVNWYIVVKKKPTAWC